MVYGNKNSNRRKIYSDNIKSNKRKQVCSYYSVLKEQWIRSKYEHKQFMEGAKEPSYINGIKFKNCT